jgi:hypothetical protein
MSWRHPSDDALGRWSAGGSGRRAARHAEHCPMCLERLEQITDLEPRIRAELELDLMPRPTLENALWDRLEARMAEREAVSVLTELMDVGPETSRLLLEGSVDEGAEDG